jgi:hypothetical protein
MARKNKDVSQMSPAGRAALVVVAVLQVLLTAAAFWDLAQRRADEVRGPKPAWIPVILVNWVGPAVYFVFGVRRSTR